VKAEKNLQEAEDAANAARAQRLAIESEISACHAAKGRLLDRLNSCKRDFAAERESHLQTVAELYGRSEDSPATASRLRLALNNLSDLPVLEKVVPKLRKQLEADLSKVEARLTELTTGKK
jgi:chromosome segregation ATPase